MDLDLSPEQEQLRRSARRLLVETCAPTRVRALRGAAASSSDLWQTMCRQGWTGLAVAEQWGGSGGTLEDLAVVFEECGRVVAPTWLSTAVGAALLIERVAGEADCERLLPPLLEGRIFASVIWQAPVATDGRLTGGVPLVADAPGVDLLVVVAGSDVVAVPAGSPGVTVKPVPTFDGSVQASVTFDAVEVETLAHGASAAVTRILNDLTALRAVEMAGGARSVLERTVAYVTSRQQFGRAIGSFQAVQHQVADIAMLVDAATLAAWQAVTLCSAGQPASREVAVAKAAANRAYRDATLTAHQLHGGIGFALEHDLHLWSDRAAAAALTMGTTVDHRRRLARSFSTAPG